MSRRIDEDVEIPVAPASQFVGMLSEIVEQPSDLRFVAADLHTWVNVEVSFLGLSR